MDRIYIISVKANGPKAAERIQRAIDALNEPERGYVGRANFSAVLASPSRPPKQTTYTFSSVPKPLPGAPRTAWAAWIDDSVTPGQRRARKEIAFPYLYGGGSI